MAKTARFRFEPDSEGIFEATSGEAVRGILTQRAQDAAKEVRRLGPKKRRSFLGYRASVRARPAQRVGQGFEAAVEVASPGWHLPEYGTSKIPVTAPLRRGVQLAGIDFKEGR